MIKMHVAASGERAGEYVPCPARFSCRLATPEEHLFFETAETAEEYNELQLAEQYGVSGEFTVKSKERMREIERKSIDYVESVKARAKNPPKLTPKTSSKPSSPSLPQASPTPKLSHQNQADGLLNTLNPTGTVHIEYNPKARVGVIAGNLAPLSETLGINPDEDVLIYRGVPKGVQGEIVAGDFITTNRQLAQDYAGTGDVLEMLVKAGEILDDKEDPGGEEYLYRPDLLVDG